ncbi:MAG: ClpXP protease specificity-enhancing factor SspB [Myxococcota bacterium]
MDKTLEKKERLLTALDKGLTMVHLDARRAGVLVPSHLKTEAHLLLNLSYRFDPPDLSVGEWGIRSTLTFSGKRFTVAIPWSALYAITSHVTKEFWMYPDDMPAEILEAAKLTSKVPLEDGPMKKTRGLLREVVAEKPAPDEKKDEPPKPRGRGHLRVVK